MKRFLLAIFILPVVLFSYEINFSKSFTTSVSPDLLTTYVDVSIFDEKERVINSEIEKFNDFFKEYDEVVIKDGRYNLSPRYKYINNKQIFTGYIGSLRYKIESNSAKNINEFINQILELKDRSKNDELKLNISNINWNVSNELYNKNLDNLRIESILWINDYAKSLSNKISKRCSVEKLDINSVNRGNIYMARESVVMSAKVASDVTPASSDENITINPSFVLECK
jgi:predicted secreted protein